MASGLCAALARRTDRGTDQPEDVKKALANSEPTTHDRYLIRGGHYGQRLVCRANRPNTWLHRPACKREENPCQLGAVHTWLPAQPVDATQALNFSAGVSNRRVLRGRSLSWRATLLRWACEYTD